MIEVTMKGPFSDGCTTFSAALNVSSLTLSATRNLLLDHPELHQVMQLKALRDLEYRLERELAELRILQAELSSKTALEWIQKLDASPVCPSAVSLGDEVAG